MIHPIESPINATQPSVKSHSTTPSPAPGLPPSHPFQELSGLHVKLCAHSDAEWLATQDVMDVMDVDVLSQALEIMGLF